MNDENWKPYFEFDALAENLLPPNWEKAIFDCVERDSISSTLNGGGSSDLTMEGPGVEINLRLVTGDVCKSRIPWLYKLYREEFRIFSEERFGTNLFCSNDQVSAININCLEGIGARYETHCDSNPVTGLLFACNADFESGGELVFLGSGGKQSVVRPRAGLFICFDARKIPHFVSPLNVNFMRISVPMNFYTSEVDQYRPPGLDDRLYKQYRSQQ